MTLARRRLDARTVRRTSGGDEGSKERGECSTFEKRSFEAIQLRLEERIDELDRKTDDLEGRPKRNNLIFYGLSR